jgi:hypothetical protein
MSIAAVKQQIGKILNLHGGSIPDHDYQGLLAFAEKNGVDERQLRYQLLPDLVNSFNIVAHERQRELAVQQLEHYVKERFSVGQKLKPVELERVVGFAYDLDIPRPEAFKRLQLLGIEFQDGQIQDFRPHLAYARYPDRKTGFSNNQLSSERNEESLYELHVTSPCKAEFQVLSDSLALFSAIEDLATFLDPACRFLSAPEFGERLRNVNSGSLQLEEGVWVVKSKVEIEFANATPNAGVSENKTPKIPSNQNAEGKTTEASLPKAFPDNLLKAIRKHFLTGPLTDEQLRDILKKGVSFGLDEDKTRRILFDLEQDVETEKAAAQKASAKEVNSTDKQDWNLSPSRWSIFLIITLVIAAVMAIMILNYVLNGTGQAPPTVLKYKPFQIDSLQTQEVSDSAVSPFNTSDVYLISEHYQIDEFLEGNKGRYKDGDTWFQVSVSRTEMFEYKGVVKTLVFFENHSEDLCFACSGFVSIAEYVYNNGNWDLNQFIPDCECGYSVYGAAEAPQLISIHGRYFLKRVSYASHQGYGAEDTRLYNVEDYSVALNITTSSNNGGAAQSENDIVTTESKLIYELNGDSLLLHQIAINTYFDDLGEKVQKKEITTFIYDEDARRFNSTSATENQQNSSNTGIDYKGVKQYDKTFDITDLEEFTGTEGVYRFKVPKGLFVRSSKDEFTSDLLQAKIRFISKITDRFDRSGFFKKEDLTRAYKSKINVQYFVEKNDWFVLSGKNPKNNIIYMKGFYEELSSMQGREQGEPSWLWSKTGVLEIQYSEKSKEQFDELIPLIMKSFQCDFSSM